MTTRLTYELLDDPPAIRCLLCGRISDAPDEVARRYCARCRLLHDAVTQGRIGVASGGNHECDEWPTWRGYCALCGASTGAPPWVRQAALCPHQWEVIAQITQAEIDEADEDAHTAFALLGCSICRTVDAFPPVNAALCTARYITCLRVELSTGGWILPAGITWGPR